MQKVWDIISTFINEVSKIGAVGWFIALASLAFNLFQFRHARRRHVKVKISQMKDGRPGNLHCRWLIVDVLNDGTELNDVYVTLNYLHQDGGKFEHPMQPVGGETPNPFKFGYSCRFVVKNDDPSIPSELLNVRLRDVVFVVRSRHSEVRRISAKKWRRVINDFGRVDEKMPRKPPPASIRPKVTYPDWNTKPW